jgi:diaminobutyrate-2-oxoglutarate transaminase
MNIFQRRESEVRSYVRSFPVVFERASGSFLFDREGRRYIDFFCGASALNYGHNPPAIKEALIRYLEEEGVAHSLDMATVAKQAFLERFESVILQPRRLDYKVQFTAPTGANGVEAALKLARKVTGRRNVIAFSQGYHGLSAGALAVTANQYYRHESWINRTDVSFLPYDGYLGAGVDTIDHLRRVLADSSSGVDKPAAVIVETVQAEGGVNIACRSWLRELAALCRAHGALLIVDDIQVGCGRTGPFFSFEPVGIEPDMVVLSKSLSGFGLPMTLLLLRPEIDQWRPGEHTGTFRGNNLAFVAATQALRFWETAALSEGVAARGQILERGLRAIAAAHPGVCTAVRGVGLIYGLEFAAPEACAAAARESFAHGLIIEICGSLKNVLKFLPPLTIDESTLAEGLSVVAAAVATVAAARTPVAAETAAGESRVPLAGAD